MKSQPKISEIELKNLYVDQNLSIHKVGKIINVSGDTVSRWLKYYNVKLRNDPTRFNYIRNINLSKIQYDLLIGSMLGDGNLDYSCGSRSESCRLRFCHSVKQLEFLQYKKDILEQLVQQNIIFYNQTNRNSHECSIQTISHPMFISTYKQFYKNKIKFVPDDIANLINDFSLAIWLMDDGWKRKNQRTIILCTDSFLQQDQEKLVNALLCKFEINSKIIRNGKNWRIKISKDNVDKLVSIVKPYIIPLMTYKIK
jgi:hypothetical protein